MTAAVATRARKLLRSKPARAAHEVSFARCARGPADGAGRREEQIEERGGPGTQNRASYASAFHIALRSGSMPNQR